MSSNLSSHPWPYFVAGALTALLVFALGAGGAWLFLQSQEGRAVAPELALYNEAWDLVKQDFYGEIPSPADQTYGAIRGSVETLADPYTFFVEPEPAVREQERLQGHFGGIGAYLTLHEDGRIRLQPMVDRPAARAGVQDGDILVAIDDQTLPIPSNLDEATNQLRGPVETVVRITVLRGEQTLDFAITREQFELPSVEWRLLAQQPDVGYIRIERFSGLTDKELTQALAELATAKALVLDLRGNPGGLLDAAVAVSSHFLDGGPVLLERRSDGSEQKYTAASGGDALTAPLVVLVDGGTASAAEIVAGALGDRERADLVGEQTYGKGSIQRIHRLSDDSALHITFAKWFTPANQQIDGHGLTPDRIVSPDDPTLPEDADAALATALEMLRTTHSDLISKP